MQKHLITLIVASISGLLLTQNVQAEKADKFKKTVVSGTQGGFDIAKNTMTLLNVELTRGTLLIRAEKAVDVEIPVDKDHPEGGGTTVLTGSINNPVYFKQKRDGGADLWIEGHAQRVEYDKATEIVNFYGNAKIQLKEQDRVTKVAESEYFSYDAPNDFLNIANSVTGKHDVNGGRIKLTVEPQKTKKESK